MQAAALKLSASNIGCLLNSTAQLVSTPRVTGQPTTKQTGGLLAAGSGNVPDVDAATRKIMEVGEALNNGAPGANSADLIRQAISRHARAAGENMPRPPHRTIC
jgi:hypothetical protein